MDKITVTELASKVQTEADAYAVLESIRWANGVVCPHCGSVGRHYFLNATMPGGRRTRTGAVSDRRVWKCRDCRKQFSVITGTVMHGTKAPIRVWLFVIFEMAANKNGIAAAEIARKYGVANRTAWFMCHRVREAMMRTNPEKLIGTVIVDETWIGGNPQNRHYYDQTTNKHGGKTDKATVVTVIDKASGEARSQVVADVTARTLRTVIAKNVEMAKSVLHTDTWNGYTTVGREMLDHQAVNHRLGEYERHGVSTNHCEGFFAQLKRSLDGTHHHVSQEHLPRYLSEYDFRYSTRHLTDTDRMGTLVRQMAGRRLAYRPSGPFTVA